MTKVPGARQTLSVILVGADLKNVGKKIIKDIDQFFIDYNPELGLFINTEEANQVREYFADKKEKLDLQRLPLMFENRPTALFPQKKDVVEWLFRGGFKNGKDFCYQVQKTNEEASSM